jgi:DNA modification methylase
MSFAFMQLYIFEMEEIQEKKALEYSFVIGVPIFTDEFWTAKQRQANSIHEISYRACYKPQLPEFFINKYSNEQNVVYDPFSGRGTTVIQAGLMNRNDLKIGHYV